MSFTPCQVSDWAGFYYVPANKESRYYVNNKDELFFRWEDDSSYYECPALMTVEVQRLAKAVNNAKAQYSNRRRKGGKFVINEYGDIIVPYKPSSFDNYAPKLVGHWAGEISFESPNDDEMLSLNPDRYKHGDTWELPYLGSKYNLAARNYVYMQFRHNAGVSCIKPASMPQTLIKKIRLLKPEGGISFIVNTHGVVITKVQQGRSWIAKYVGTIDYNQWFTRDQLRNPQERKE